MQRVNIECDCLDEIFAFKFIGDMVDDDPPTLYLNPFVSTFSQKQDGIIRTIFNRVKIAWFLLRGKEYRLEDIMVSDPLQIDNLSKFLNYVNEQSQLWEKSHLENPA